MNLTLGTGNTLGTVQNTSSGTMTINSAPGTNTITSLNSSGANGKMTFIGVGSVNNMGNNFCGNSASSTNVFTSGTWSFTGGGNGANQVGTLIVNGATVTFSGGRYWHSAGGTTTVTNGTLQIAGDRWNPGEQQTAGTVIQVNVSGTGLLDITYSQYGVGLGAGTVTGNGGTLVNQTGGTVQYGITPGTGTAGFLIGGNAHTNYLCAYNLSGGILRSKATITAGAWPSGSTNAFNWSGGTLVVNGITMANMASSDGVNSATSNTLFNSAGTLAPGDVGMAGLTTITGNYTETTTNAVLAVDIGGTAKGSAFQTGSYDYLNIVNGTATFSGRLSVNLINGYVPPSTRTNFTVVAATGTNPTLAGSFANVTDGKVWCSDGYSRFDVLFNTTAKTVILTNFMVNAWSPTSGNAWTTGANWSLAEANGSDMAAYFGAGASGAVTLDTARTVRGLTFNNGSASYTLSGSATLTLQGDALTTPKLSVTAGIHTISVPIALSNATEIAVAGSSMLTLAGNVTGAQAVTKTGTGTLALSAANTLGALTISAGTVRFAAGTTTASALTITAGATCDFFAGTLYILKNGGGLDTLDKVNAAITANTITLRGKNALPIDFKVTEETIDSVVYIKVTAKLKGTMIMVL
jgi:autotransporter-associated beta strand protein